MRRIPLLATLLVALSIAAMIGLGIWQLHRLAWKEGLLKSYAAARGLPPIAFPDHADPAHFPFFRRAHGNCAQVLGWRSSSGRNLEGQPGWVHIARCRTESGGTMSLVAGWSERPDDPQWRGGPVRGVIAPDSRDGLRLVADRAAPGLRPAQPPSLDDIPNNHLAYAVQWFLFATVAAVIYALALRRRMK